MYLDDMISEDNVVRAIDAIVESMDILSLRAATMGFAKTQFKYDEKNVVYICPQGVILKQNFIFAITVMICSHLQILII